MAYHERDNRNEPNTNERLLSLVSDIIQSFQQMEEFNEQIMNEHFDEIEYLLSSGEADPMIWMNRTLPGQRGRCVMDDLFHFMEPGTVNEQVEHIARDLYELILHYYPSDKINATNSAGQTLLLMALNHDAPYDVIQNLVERGSEVDLSDEHGATALHYASVRQRPDIVHLLLESGAERQVKDKEGKTPLYYVQHQWKRASRPAIQEIKQLLEERNETGKVQNNTSTPYNNNNNNNDNNNNMDGGRRKKRKTRRHRKANTHRRRRATVGRSKTHCRRR